MSAFARFTVRTALVSATALALTVVTLLHDRSAPRPTPISPTTPRLDPLPARVPWWTHDWEATAPLLPRN